MSHTASTTGDTIYFTNGNIWGWQDSHDISAEHHETVECSVYTSKSIYAEWGQNGWGIDASASVDITAREYTIWEEKDDINYPTIIWPSGKYYLHARIDKKDELGMFQTVHYAAENTIVPLFYAGPRNKSAYAYHTETDSEKFNIDDYSAHGIGEVENKLTDPTQSAAASVHF